MISEVSVLFWCETHSANYKSKVQFCPVSYNSGSPRDNKSITDPKYWTGTSLFDNSRIETYQITAYNCLVVSRLSLRRGSPLAQYPHMKYNFIVYDIVEMHLNCVYFFLH